MLRELLYTLMCNSLTDRLSFQLDWTFSHASSPRSYSPVIPQLGAGLSVHFLSVFGLGLPCLCTGFLHTVTVTVLSVQVCNCCVVTRKPSFLARHPLLLVLTITLVPLLQ